MDVVDPQPQSTANTLAAFKSAKWPTFQQFGRLLGQLKYSPTVLAFDWYTGVLVGMGVLRM
jgi:hypothetical protein